MLLSYITLFQQYPQHRDVPLVVASLQDMMTNITSYLASVNEWQHSMARRTGTWWVPWDSDEKPACLCQHADNAVCMQWFLVLLPSFTILTDFWTHWRFFLHALSHEQESIFCSGQSLSLALTTKAGAHHQADVVKQFSKSAGHKLSSSCHGCSGILLYWISRCFKQRLDNLTIQVCHAGALY